MLKCKTIYDKVKVDQITPLVHVPTYVHKGQKPVRGPLVVESSLFYLYQHIV